MSEFERQKPENSGLRRKIAACMLALTGVFAMYGDNRMSDDITYYNEEYTEEIQDHIRIMTANVHKWDGENGNNFDNLADVIKDEEPDVICLQEVMAEKGELRDLHGLGYNVYFHSTYNYPFAGRFGNAVAAKAEIQNIDTESLPLYRFIKLGTFINFNIGIETRNVIRFGIATENTYLDFRSTHLDTNPETSNVQAKYISNMRGESMDFACGDFNQTLDELKSGPLAKMIGKRSRYTNRATFPSDNPVEQIDHIFSPCATQIGQTRTYNINSDHLGVVIDFNISNCEDIN